MYNKIHNHRVLWLLIPLLTLFTSSAWGAVGGTLKTYNTNSSTFQTGYKRQSGDNFVWWGQKNYYGANSAANHGNNKPTAADLPVVKAQKSDATTSTTGYYYLYTSEAVSNVGAVQITFSAKSGSSTVNAYIVSSSTAASSGSATWTKLTLLASSPKAQGANVASNNTYTFTIPKETSAKYYGIVFVTSSYWRATGMQMKLLEGCTAPTAVAKGTVTSSSFGLTITDAANAGTYEVYFSESSTAPDATTSSGYQTVTTKTPTITSGVAANKTYYVWVRSVKTVSSVTYKSAWVALTGSTLTTPSACTELGTINGSVSWNSPTEAVVTWNKLADQVTSWELSWSPNTVGSSITSAIADKGSTQKTATVSGLACGTEYTFTLTPTIKSGVCPVTTNPTIVSPSTKYAIAKSATNGSFTTKVSSTAVTSTCDGSTVAIDATANNGYSFTSWTITNTSTSADVTSSVSLSSSTNKNATFTMPAYAVTVTAAFSCVTPTFGTNLVTGTVEYTQGDVASALTVGASANNATINYQWQTKVGSGEWTNTGTNAPENTSITPSTASAVTTQYRCIATNAASGCSATETSNVVTIQVNEPSCTAPTAVAASSPTSRGATLTVTDDYNTNKYDFYCSTSNDAPNNLTTPTASVSGSKEKAITDLDYAKTYYYWARTDCGGQTSGWFPTSNPSTFTTTCPAPTSISAGSITRSGATFTITDNNSPTIISFGSGYGYEIYYSTTNSAPGADPSGTVTTTTTTKAVTGLTTGTTYYVWVRGYGPAAKSSWVSGGSFTVDILDHITITAPTKTTYFAGETFVSTGATVTAHYSPSGNTATVTGSATWTPTAALTTGNTTATASYTEQGVTKTANQTICVYSVTVNKVDEDGTATEAAGLTATWTVGTKTLSASATDGSKYVFKNWEFAEGDDAKGLTISNTGNASTTVSGTPTGNVTIKAVFYKPVTVTWKVGSGNASGGTGTVKRGTQWQALTLPTTPNDNALEVAQGGCIENGKGKFMGWTNASDLIGEGNSKPDVCLTSFSGVTSVINSPIVFKAVFAKGTASTTTYKRVTNISDLSGASKIVIVSNASSKVINTDCSATNAPTESSSEITASSTYIWALSGNSTDGWKFKDGSGNTLGATTVATSGNNNKLVSITSSNSTWTIGAHSTSNCFYICSGANTSSKACLDFYSPNWQLYYVTSYSSNSYTAMKLYIPKVTYSDYITKCCTHLEEFPGSFALSGVSASARSFSWENESTVGDVAHYELSYKVKNAVGDPTSIANNIANNTNSYTHTADLTAGTTYTYYLTAIGANGHCDEVETKDVTIPQITTSGTPATMTYIEGQGPSTTDCHFTVSGVGLTGDLTVTAPTNFQVSKTSSSSGFAESVTITPSSGSVSSQTIWVQMVSNLLNANSPFGGNVRISGGSAAYVDVAVSGTVSPACSNPTITAQPTGGVSYNINATPTALSVSATHNGTGPALSYQWYWNSTNSNVNGTLISEAEDYRYSPPTTAVGTKYYYCVVMSGACEVASQTASVTINQPTLTVSETTLAFGDRKVNGGPYEMTFTVSGTYLGSNIVLNKTGDSEFKIDKSSVSYGSGTVETTTITVQYTPTSAGSHSGTITISTDGVSPNKTVALSGTGKWEVTWNASGSAPRTTLVANGARPTLPSDPSSCDATSTTFMGWTLTAWTNKQNQAYIDGLTGDAVVHTDNSAMATITDNGTVYHAVFAEAVEGNDYEIVTSLDAIKEGDAYFAFYGQHSSIYSWYGVNSISTAVAPVTVTDGALTTSKTGDGAYTLQKFTLVASNASNHEYYIKIGDKYVTGSSTSSTDLSLGDDAYLWTFNSINESSHNLEIKHALSAYSNCWIKVGISNTTSAKFRSYTSTGQQVALFQKSIGYANYLTTCCENNVTIGEPTITEPTSGCGTVAFSTGVTPTALAIGDDVATCACTTDTTITVRVTPATGYKCTALEFSDGTNTLTPNPTTASTLPIEYDGHQDYTLTFAKNTNITLNTAVTFSQIMVSSLKLKATQTGESDKIGNDLTMTCYPKEGQASDPLEHSLKVEFNEVLPANALDKTYDWSVRVKATGDADWTDVAFNESTKQLNTNAVIYYFHKNTGTLQIKAAGTAEIKITAHDGSGVSAKVTITVTDVAMSEISTDPSSVTVYSDAVGSNSEQNFVNVPILYTPANATFSGTPYTTGSYSYVTTTASANSIKIQAKANVTTEQEETVTLTTKNTTSTTTGSALTTTITVTIKPMPRVYFQDIVHGEDFDDVVATVNAEDRTEVLFTKNAQTHVLDITPYDPATANDCVNNHLHLVGWIRSDCPVVEAYLAGGSKPDMSAITGAGLDDNDKKYYLIPNESIDTRDYDGKTFYAVWAQIE